MSDEADKVEADAPEANDGDMVLESETVMPAESPVALKAVISAMVFAAKEPLGIRDMRKIIREVADENEGSLFGDVKDKQIKNALAELEQDLEKSQLGLRLIEFADGFAFQTDAECGPWLRKLLKIEPRRRLSKPALETLAIIAYRQPVVRSEIEGVRGVSVDHIIRTLLELQLIRITGRSELPGRPLMYGTTQHFLDHFGLKGIGELPGIEQLSRAEADRIRAEEDSRKSERGGSDEGDEDESGEAAAEGAEATPEQGEPAVEASDAPEADAAPEPEPAEEAEPEPEDDEEDEYDDDDDDR